MQGVLDRVRDGLDRTEEITGELSGETTEVSATLVSEPLSPPILDSGDFVILFVLLFIAGAAVIAWYLNQQGSGEQRTKPFSTYRLLRTTGLFLGVAALTVYLQDLETASKAAEPGSDLTVNQLHRWFQFSANTTWGILNWVLLIDILSFRFANVIELIHNKADVGREDIFKPIDKEFRIELLRIYGLTLCVFIYSANIVFGN